MFVGALQIQKKKKKYKKMNKWKLGTEKNFLYELGNIGNSGFSNWFSLDSKVSLHPGLDGSWQPKKYTKKKWKRKIV